MFLIKSLTSWSSFFSLVLCSGLLNSCGFQPLYKQPSLDIAQAMQDIKIEVISDRSGQQLRNFLLDKLTTSSERREKKYRLHITLSESDHLIGFRKDQTPRYKEVILTVSMNLRTIPDSHLLFSKKLKAFASYPLGGHSSFGAFSSEVAEKSARTDALRSLSDDIKLEIAAFLASHHQQDSVTKHYHEP